MQMESLLVSDGTDTARLIPGRESWTVELDVPPDESERIQRLLEAAAQAATIDGGGRLDYWVERVGDESDQIPMAAGYTPTRDLWRLRRPLPALETDLPTRAFVNDEFDFLEVNNRAFAWHPEQGAWTDKDLSQRQAESWYDPDGFRLWERDGRLGGFCWTKVHHDSDPKLGEIYSIAVDPDFHGEGVGRELVLAGLAWLSEQHLRHAILYVESDNQPANQIYRKLGFDLEYVNRCYQRTVRRSALLRSAK
jgi:mycothiol synthase